MKQIQDLSPNYSKKSRLKSSIKFVIIHYTGMQSEIESLRRLKDKNSKVSCHYLIGRNGNIIQLVNENKIAWHAGKSKWKGFTNLNKNSIGVELVNKGHNYGYEKFSINQIKSLELLCKKIKKKYKISNNNFLGHSDIAPLRKIDPGEKFPWKLLYKNKIGIWHNINSRKIKTFRGKISESNLIKFINNLKKIGYRIEYSKSNELKKLIKIFQMRFRPELIDGKLDLECYMIAKSLVNLK